MRSSFAKTPNGASPIFALICAALLLAIALHAVAQASDAKEQNPEEISRKTLKDAKKDLRKGRAEEAETALRVLVERQPRNAAARSGLAYVLFKQKKLREAYELSFDVVKENPKDSFALAVLGNVLVADGNFPEAKVLLVSSLNIKRKEPLAWAGMGLVDFYENRLDRAIENLEAASYLDPREPDFAFALAQVSARAEKYAKAAAAYERFLAVAPKADRDRRERIEGLVRFLKFLGSRTSLYEIEGTNAKISIAVESDRPVMTVFVNGKKEPLKFVLDTGSGISVISKKTAERLGIKPVTKGGMARAIGGTGKFPIVYGFLRNIAIGDVKIRNVPVYIREFFGPSAQVDGYIGIALISKFLTTLDYGAKTFSLKEKNVSEAEGAPKDSVELPLRLTSSGFLSGEVVIEGIENPLNFIVDTGASISVISSEVAALEQIGRHAREDRLRVVGAAGVLDDVRHFVIPKVSFGNNSLEGVRAVELDLSVINEASGFRQAGILGGNFLKNYRLVFDFKNSKVVFRKND